MCVFLLLFLYYSSNNNLENEISNAKLNMLRVIERAFECHKPWNSYKCQENGINMMYKIQIFFHHMIEIP